MPDHRNDIVQGALKWRWPWDRAQDVELGSGPRPHGGVLSPAPAPAPTPTSAGAADVKQAQAKAQPRLDVLEGARKPAVWQKLLVTVIVVIALIYHAAPQIGRLVGPDQARLLLAWLADLIPVVGGIDAGRWLGPGAAAWMWQPVVAAGGAGLLRLAALNAAGREPIGALWLAFFALLIDGATWLFMGLKLQGQAFDAAEAQALITLLKIEGATLLVAFFILAPAGKKRLGQTDAGFNGGN